MSEVNLKQAVEDARALRRTFRSVDALIDVLDGLGNLEQVIRETEIRKQKAQDEAAQIERDNQSASMAMGAARADIEKAKEHAVEIVDTARHEAEGIVADAQKQVDELIATAQGKLEEIERRAALAEGRVANANERADEAEARVIAASNKLEDLRSQIAAL